MPVAELFFSLLQSKRNYILTLKLFITVNTIVEILKLINAFFYKAELD